LAVEVITEFYVEILFCN